MKAIERLLFTLIFATSSAASAGPAFPVRAYVVQSGDTLSQIADRVRGGHTYGKDENLEKILNLNPDVVAAQHIYVGQTIVIPADTAVRLPSSEVPATKTQAIIQQAQVVASTTTETSVAVAPTSPVPATTPVPVSKPIPAPPATVAPTQVPSAAVVAPVAPSPAPAQTPVVTAAAEEEEVPHRVKLSALYQFTTLEAIDKTTTRTASLYTNHDVQVAVAAEQDWTEEFKTHLEFAFRHLQFMPSTSTTKTIAKETQTLSKVSVGGKVDLSKSAALYFDAIYGQQLFVHGLSSTEVTADTVGIPEARVGLDLGLLKKGSTTLGLVLDGSYLGKASTDTYDIESGYAYGGALYVRRNKANRSLDLQIGLRYRKQDTSYVELDEQNIFGAFTYGFDIFGGDK